MSSLVKRILSSIIPSSIWGFLREKRIIRQHKKVAKVCEALIEDYFKSGDDKASLPVHAITDLGTDKIIWQYWAQGYDDVPDTIRQCLDSVDKWKGEYTVIRLDDNSIAEYIELPSYILDKKNSVSRAHFSDVLRLCLLQSYGGIWMDATIYMSGHIQEELQTGDFFVYQRDPEEPAKEYWENTYAYYFGWGKGFRVNMLNAIMYSRKNTVVINTLCGIMLYYWKTRTSIPDYFFFQILFDVLIHNHLRNNNCKLVSDCLPHMLQQSINDRNFNLASKSEILGMIHTHKLTYKKNG